MQILIIGAGLAGCSAAYFLAREGHEVTILDGEKSIAARASGNHLGIVLPYVAIQKSYLTDFHSAAFNFFLQHITEVEMRAGRKIFYRSGVLQFPYNAKTKKIISVKSKIDFCEVMTAEQANGICNLNFKSEMIYFSEGGYLSPRDLCQAYLQAFPEKIRFINSLKVSSFEYQEGQFFVNLACGNDLIKCDKLIISTAHECNQLGLSLRVEAVRGQLATLKQNEYSGKLGVVLSTQSYITPAYEGAHMLGASYAHNDNDAATRSEETLKMIANINNCDADTMFAPEDLLSERVCFRTSTHDRLPYAGQLADNPSLFVTVGHGARGTISCPISASLLADKIAGRSSEYQNLEKLIDPRRG